jgi:hypothetical protein
MLLRAWRDIYVLLKSMLVIINFFCFLMVFTKIIILLHFIVALAMSR